MPDDAFLVGYADDIVAVIPARNKRMDGLSWLTAGFSTNWAIASHQKADATGDGIKVHRDNYSDTDVNKVPWGQAELKTDLWTTNW